MIKAMIHQVRIISFFKGFLGLGLDLTTVIKKGLAETEVVMAAIMEHE